ncbi:MAG: hypothetical protein UY63_C0021G0004 [Parcubacteria group bacterium GW2011_GWA2_51_10]|nr:MAG: hypothetical protein UY63_C0021G0004 [Parcubacteria group bacterium GW2011_GWA2_51_10]
MALGLAGPTKAATAPDLGTAANFAVLAGSAISDVVLPSVITGHVGLSPTGGTAITGLTCPELVGFNIYDTNAGYAGGGGCLITNASLLITAKGDLDTAYLNAAAQATTSLIVADLGGQTLTPGVYANASSIGLTGTLTLSGGADDVFIFKAGSTLTTASNAQVVLTGGVQACNVFWQIGSSVTLGTTTTIRGNILAKTAITDDGGSTVYGRLLARDAAVTLSKTTVTKQTCTASAPALPASSLGNGTVNVVKVVINDGGGTKTIADFPLFVNGLLVVSGQTNNFPAPAGVYTVTETTSSLYTRTFSGDCNSNGQFNLNKGNSVFCIVTNNDIAAPLVPPVPPLIDVVKVASPLSLPLGPGPVTYTYTVRNIGTVPMTNITMVGDTCSPIVLVSGDTDGDSQLDVNETWVHTCSTTLTETHTNTVVATGWANGISSVDIASAIVVVGLPIVPPLIHVVKTPNKFDLPAPGGAVTYFYSVTNPGTEPLSDVTITDNKCTGLPGRVVGHPGDLNKNNLLESNETWQFTCKTNLKKTTTNIGTAQGSANGLTVRDFSIVTVVVGAVVPKLPNTGFAPWEMAIPAGIFAAAVLFYFVRRKQIV